MKRKFYKSKATLIITILFLGHFSYAQTYEALGRVYIPNNTPIKKTIVVENCNKVFAKGCLVKKEYVKIKGGVTYTMTRVDSEKSILIDTSIVSTIKDLSGYANISTDEKDASILHINYFLNPKHRFWRTSNITLHTRKIDCSGVYRSYKDTSYDIPFGEKKYLWKCYAKDSSTNWFKNSDVVMEVHKKKSKVIEFYLVNKYDQNADYTLKLENRQFISYRAKGIEFGPLTIPFKYRFAGKSLKDEFTADYNIGAFIGWKIFGRYRVRLEGKVLKELPSISCVIGGFINLSSTTLDSESTINDNQPLSKDQKQTIGIYSPGFGIMLTLYNFQFGTLLGWDEGIGHYSEKWDYNKKPWLGFGIAYSLSNFWKK